MDLKLVAMQDSYSPTIEEIKKDPMDKESMLDLFIESLITLKTKVKLQFLEKENKEITQDDLKLAKINIQTLILIKSLKLFIKWYSEKANKDIIKFIDDFLMNKKEELYFSDLKVDFEANDINTMNNIIDALGVKFYQEVIYALNLYFNGQDQVFIITGDEKKTCYTMGYRNMNIMEIDNKHNGKLNINVMK